MIRKQLTEICRPKQWKTIPGKDLKDHGFPVYGANGIIGYWNEYNHEKETLTIACRGTCGTVNIAEQKSYVNGNAMCLDELSDDVDLKYLYYYLKGYDFSEIISGTTIPQVTIEGLKKVAVAIPSKERQHELATIFDKVSEVISNRQQELQKLDELAKARFVEMFGTYPANEKGWTTGTIRDLVTEVRYGSSRKSADGDSGKYPYLRMNNITYGGELDLSDTKTIDVPEEELPKCTVRRGDVLFNRTNSKELVGKTCVYNRDEMMVLAGFVVRVRLNEQMLPEVMSGFLNTDFSKQMLLGMCKAAIGQANINAQELQNIGIYIPPMDLQKEFVAFKEQLDKSKVAVQKSLDEARLLFDSLMQQYFG